MVSSQSVSVIPTQVEIHFGEKSLDSRFHGNDKKREERKRVSGHFRHAPPTSLNIDNSRAVPL
jgi:hypothetical protein